jgi:2-oxoglutarate ferredoxin oxidoreductase subunit delta
MRGTIVIDENRCKGCEMCILVCPKHLIGMAETFTPRGYRPARLFDPRGDCTGCLLCAVMCPDVAITVYRADPRKKANLQDETGLQNQALAGEQERTVQPPR